MHKALRVEFTRGGEILRYLEQEAAWQRLEKAGSLETEGSSKQEGSAEQENDRTDSKPYGSYTLNGDSRITFSLNGVSYEGVIVQLNDEAGNPTMCITGVGENQSAWAVTYI
jgi:hypothetical protein